MLDLALCGTLGAVGAMFMTGWDWSEWEAFTASNFSEVSGPMFLSTLLRIFGGEIISGKFSFVSFHIEAGCCHDFFLMVDFSWLHSSLNNLVWWIFQFVFHLLLVPGQGC